MLQKGLCVFQKARYVFKKLHHLFKKARHLFQKARHLFIEGRLYPTLTNPVIPFFRSSLHFNQNMQTISLLRMTEYPLIFVSAVLVKPFQICLRRFPFLRMKGGWKGDDEVSTHCRNPINRVFQRLMKGERKKLSGWYGNFIIKMFQPFLNSSGKRDGWWISQGKIIVYGTFSG